MVFIFSILMPTPSGSTRTGTLFPYTTLFRSVRAPYNILFDYSLLRVGAVLEDGGTTLACRRKKGTSGTLLGADDVPIDEAPLAAMLRGQTRDTFGLSFSLDQETLRSGGKAMVEEIARAHV